MTKVTYPGTHTFCNVRMVHFKQYDADQQYYSMETVLNQTHLSLKDSQIIVVTSHSQPPSFKCKICYSEATNTRPLSPVCSCKDKECHAHSDCLKTYLQTRITRSLEIQGNSQHFLTCQKCSQNYRATYHLTRKCSEYQTIKRKIQRKNFLFGLLFFGLVLSIITLGICADRLKKSYSQPNPTSNLPQKQILIVFLIFFSILLLFFGCKICEKFMTEHQVIVQS